MTQQYHKISNCPAIYNDKIYVSKGPRLGKFQPGNKKVYTTAVFQDWEHLSSVIK